MNCSNEKNSICFCADGNYLEFIVPLIESIERQEPDTYEYHVISDVHTNKNLEEKIKILLGENSSFVWHKADLSEYDGLKEVAHFTKAMYYRLSIPRLIKKEKVLYMDCDMLVRKPLKEIFSVDLQENYIAGVINPFFNRQELVEPKDYFNSGLMLINTKRWLEHGLDRKVVDILKSHADLMLMPDQDALNYIINGKWHRLRPTYNAQMSMFYRYKELSNCGKEFSDLSFLDDPVVVHFSASNKAWHKTCNLKYAFEYRKLESAFVIKKQNKIIDFIKSLLIYFRERVLKKNKFFEFGF